MVSLPSEILANFVSNLVIFFHHCFLHELLILFLESPLFKDSLIELSSVLIVLTADCRRIMFLTF